MSVIKNKKKIIVFVAIFLILLAAIVLILSKKMKSELVLNVIKEPMTINDRQNAEPDYNDILEEHFLIAENNNFKMYFEDDGLSVILVDKKTGNVLRSTKKISGNDKNLKNWIDFMASGLSIEMIKNGTTLTERYTMYSDNVTKEITYYKDGFSAIIDMLILDVDKEEQHVKLQFDVCLTDEGIDAYVPSSSIEDTAGDRVDKLSSLYIYPFMGSTYLDEQDGYMFIPDGSGVLVSLEDHNGRFTTPYSSKIYGTDMGVDVINKMYNSGYPDTINAEPIYIPLFGIVYSKEQTGVMGFIKNGSESAKVLAYPNGVSTDYNWITAQYFLRDTYIHQTSKNGSQGITAYEKKLKGTDIHVSYYFMSEDASYNRMAEIYRNYLIEEGVLKKQNIDYKVGLDVVGAENEDGLVRKRTYSMTTIEDISDMIDSLKENGVEGINLIYRGWQKGGYDNGFPIDEVKVENKIGGKRELKKLIEKINQMEEVEFSLHNDLGIAAKNRVYDTGRDIVKRIDKLIFDDGEYFLTPIKLLEVSKNTLPDYQSMKVQSLAVSGITNNLYTYIGSDKTVGREQTKLEHGEVFRSLSENIQLYMDAPYDYLWKYAKGIYNMPLSGSNYSYVSAEIPFLSIVLKGYMPMYSEYFNLNAAPSDYALKLAEAGVFPNFIITKEDNTLLTNTTLDYIFTSQFDDFDSTIVETYKELKQLNEIVSDAVIVNHEILEENFVRVTYDNGVCVYINYSNKTKQIDNIEVSVKSFRVVR